jgi:hypothetical protein
LTELIDVAIDVPDSTHVRAQAAAVGLPLELALYIAVEAEHALDNAAEVVGLARAVLIEFLDVAAADRPERGPRHQFVRPLEDYATAIERGLPHVDVAGAVCARVPHRVASAWAHAAAAAAMPFDLWLAETVKRADPQRAPWEAAAARTGRTLAEWVLVQAARCARSRNTSPQAAASG